jgi:hypothetical protein
MTDPATSEDVKKAEQSVLDRLDALERKAEAGMEGFRQQQSAEHGALFSVMRNILEAINWLKGQWIKFTKS